MKYYYIYIHKDPVTLELRYIGKGTGDRAWRLKRRGPHHQAWLNSLLKNNLLPIIEIIEYFENENLCLDREEFLIKKELENNPKLTNFLIGGKGNKGGTFHPMYGKKHSKETKNKMSNSSHRKTPPKEVIENLRKIGSRKRTKEEIENLKNFTSKPVFCKQTNKIYKSAKIAANLLKLDNSLITKVCKKKQAHTKGYNFIYYPKPEHLPKSAWQVLDPL
jgi:hypothetical protein